MLNYFAIFMCVAVLSLFKIKNTFLSLARAMLLKMTKKLVRRENRQGLGGLGDWKRLLNANAFKASRTFNIGDTWCKLTKWGPWEGECPLRSLFFNVIQVYFLKSVFHYTF